MFNLKTISVITLTISICALASNASAQMNTQTLENAQPLLSQSTITVKSAETERRVMPSPQRVTRKVTRIVKPVTALVSTTQQQQKNVYGGTINANTSVQMPQGRIFYNRRKDDTSIPVYFNKESIKSR